MKILLYGLGYQGRKYYFYLKSRYNCSFDIITKKGKKYNFIALDDKVYKYNNYTISKDDIDNYDIIIIAVSPLLEQERIVNELLNFNIKGKVIIEKPVVKDLAILEKLVYKNNFYFFCDEVINGRYIKGFLKKDLINFKKKYFFIPNLEYHIFEHAICNFLFLDKNSFWNFLENISVELVKGKTLIWRKIFYKIILDDLSFINIGGKFLVKMGNKYVLKKIEFSEVLNFYLFNLNEEDNLFFKKNYFIFRKFIKERSLCLYE